MNAVEAVTIAVGISTLVTFTITKLWDAWRMEKKYRLQSAAEECMKKRQEAEEKIKKRLMLGNLIMYRLCQKLDIPESEIRALEKAVGIKIDK